MSHAQFNRSRKQSPAPARLLSADLAAAKIQSSFRGYQVRKKYHHHGQPPNSKAISVDHPASCIATTTEGHVVKGPATAISRAKTTVASHPPSEADRAAARIQASFRGYMVRRSTKGSPYKSECSVESDSDLTQRQAGKNLESVGFPSSKSVTLPLRAQNQNINLLPSSDTARLYDTSGTMPTDSIDSAMMNKAATVIQANYRGYHTRRILHPPRYHHHQDAAAGKNDPPVAFFHDSNKENADQAATRIQAVYRGFITRKRLKSSEKATKNPTIAETQQSRHISANEAATRIQAAYRGFNTRQRIHLLKRHSPPTS